MCLHDIKIYIYVSVPLGASEPLWSGQEPNELYTEKGDWSTKDTGVWESLHTGRTWLSYEGAIGLTGWRHRRKSVGRWGEQEKDGAVMMDSFGGFPCESMMGCKGR